MAKTLIDKALERIEALKKEVAELQEFVDAYRKVAPILGDSGYDAPKEVRDTLEKHTPQRKIHAAARQILTERGCPVSTRELYDALIKRDILIGGAKPQANLSAKLSHAPDLVNIRGSGWWFAEGMQTEQNEPPSDESLNGSKTGEGETDQAPHSPLYSNPQTVPRGD